VSPSSSRVALERAWARKVLLAVEVLDAVTLARVSAGLDIAGDGLKRKPIVNHGGLFVWLEEDLAGLQKITVDPGRLPYEPAEVAAANVKRPLTTVQLVPRVDYAFPIGITGFRGTLVEHRLPYPQHSAPVAGAEVRLRWLDEDGVTWRDPATSVRTSEGGDFAAFVRLAAADVPLLDATGAVTVRLSARRGATELRSPDLKLPQGRIAEPATFAQEKDALTFAWDELQP
jgi:hypothetical protein